MRFNYNDNEHNRKGGFDYDSAYSDAENVDWDDPPMEFEEEEEQPERRRSAVRIKRKKKKKKKLIIAIAVAAGVLIALAIAIPLIVINSRKPKEPEAPVPVSLEIRDQKVTVNQLYTYGTNLNMSGTLPYEIVELKNIRVDLVLYDGYGAFISVPIDTNEETFEISSQKNNGLYLDTIKRGTYTMFIRVASKVDLDPVIEETTTKAAKDGEEETTKKVTKKKPDEVPEIGGEGDDGKYFFRYYALKNDSGYDKTTYYTMSSYGNCIVIAGEQSYPTLEMTVAPSSVEAYDVVIDAARGGTDKGTVGVNGKTETDFNLPLALKIKSLLEAKGMKVALTRSSETETLKPYGDDGRIARAMKTNAKIMISLTMNSQGKGGLEIYAPSNCSYAFAELLVQNIQKETGIANTTTTDYMKGQNIFARTFSQRDVNDTIASNEAAGLIPYEPTTDSCYYYIIRETGGVATGAFKDDRNPKEPFNPYAHTNTGIETYIAELGYITVEEDVKIMETKMDGYARAIADALYSKWAKIERLDDSKEAEGTEETESTSPETKK